MAPAGATHSLTVPPRFCCKSSSRSGLVGSAVATVTVELSMAIGQARFWRKYLGDSVLTRGSEDAISSADMKGRPCWIASARSTSSDAARFTEASVFMERSSFWSVPLGSWIYCASRPCPRQLRGAASSEHRLEEQEGCRDAAGAESVRLNG